MSDRKADSDTVPMDATAAQAEAVMNAAIAWAWALPTHQELRMTQEEWRLFEALRAYGETYKGLRSQ